MASSYVSAKNADMNTTPHLLATPLAELPAVGRRWAQILGRLGLRRAYHLLFYFPKDYQDAAEVPMEELEDGKPATVSGVVEETGTNEGTGRATVYGILVRQDHHYLRAVWFNQPYLVGRYRRGQRLRLTGKPYWRGLRWEMHHPKVEVAGPDGEFPRQGLLPVYRLTEGISQHQMRQLVERTVRACRDHLEDVLPEEFRRERGLMAIAEAVEQIHRPSSIEALEAAQTRFRYQELLVLQLALQWRRQQRGAEAQAPSLPISAKIDARIRRLLPFALTSGQEQVVREIAQDMGRAVPMHRLLQGDVGSGKTVVAAYAMLLAVAHGHQAAMMAPTELLALQHFQVLGQLLAASRVRMDLLVGSKTDAQRRDVLEKLDKGELDLVVGTHALSQQDVRFARLGLVVVDEQHKFGVRQRALLRASGGVPHYLVMTATPIPRTVALAVFGDLDVSTIPDLPEGRQPYHTYVGRNDQVEKWWDFVARKLREGRQAYVVAPYVDRTAEDDLRGAEQVYEALSSGPLEAFRLGLVHGRIPRQQQDAVLGEFRAGKLQVLVATSLIEVGIDVPNATLMTVLHADRFGLAQLHQLRGRVTRGRYPGYICLFPSDEHSAAVERLERFAQTRSGFEVAELDFQLRGAGELLGLRQHGATPLVAADLHRDGALLERARKDAIELLAADPQLRDDRFARLRRMVLRRYGTTLHLSDAG